MVSKLCCCGRRAFSDIGAAETCRVAKARNGNGKNGNCILNSDKLVTVIDRIV